MRSDRRKEEWDERDIVLLLTSGMPDTMLAKRLGRSLSSVQSKRSRLRRQLAQNTVYT
jgi:DNA-binding NarL/FixJ family response regulator